MKKNEIPIFFAVDDKYIPFLSVTIQSLIDNITSDCKYILKILYTKIEKENMVKIKKYESENIEVEFVDLSEYIKEINDKLYTRDYYSKTTYFRLFLPELYPQYDKVIYLDSDVVLLEDVAHLYNVDMGDNLLAAAPDAIIQTIEVFRKYSEAVVKVKSYKDYFNAGVLVMNLKELRKFKFQEKFIDALSKIKYSVAQDQDYLNSICMGRVKKIEYGWNVMPVTDAPIEEKDIKLIHYNLAYKPWHFENILYDKYFWKYAEKTEFFETIQKIKDNYTEEEKEEDLAKDRGLRELAQRETDSAKGN